MTVYNPNNNNKINNSNNNFKSRASSAGTATSYGLDDRGSEFESL
jgi:hypothetical protein